MNERYLDPETHDGERYERDLCAFQGRPWARLTVAEQERAREMVVEADHAGHRRLCWVMPVEPWPLGAVWGDRTLWGVPVARSGRRAVLTARRRWRRRQVVGVLRGSGE